jgi:hypothetical protein
LETQLEEHRQQLATVIARTMAKRRSVPVKTPRRKIRPRSKKPKPVSSKRRAPSKRTRRRPTRKTRG